MLASEPDEHQPKGREAQASGRPYWWQVLKRTALAAVVVHVAFSGVLWAVGAIEMLWVNIGITALYGLMYALLLKRANRAAFAVLVIEIFGHAGLATWFLGWDSGFHYYLLLLMPLIFIDPRGARSFKLTLGTLLAAWYVGLDFLGRTHTPVNAIHGDVLMALRCFNSLTTMVLLGYLAQYYFGAVRRAEYQLKTLATTDPLTGLANRRQLLDVASRLMRRRRSDAEFSVVLCDIDHFKSINDLCGHEAGDAVLSHVAGVLDDATRDTDVVGRWGGEEFLIVLPETDLTSAVQVAERARVAVKNAAVLHGGRRHGVTMTFGASRLRPDEPLESAIARADAAMYQGKQAGRDQCVAESSDHLASRVG